MNIFGKKALKNIESKIQGVDLVSIFDEKVREHPNKIAVVDYGNRATFSNIHRISLLIANRLIDTVTDDEKYVAVLMDNNYLSIATIFGILRAGLAYVPLNIKWGCNRIANIIKASSISTVIHSGGSKELELLESIGLDLALIDVVQVKDLQQQKELRKVKKHDAAYVIFTSGSTGEPKGVIQTHSSLLFDAFRQKVELDINENDRIGMVSGITSSVSGCAIFGGLLNGASVSCFQPEKRSLKSILQWICDTDVTISDVPVSIIRVLAYSNSTKEERKSKALRIIAPVGETLFKKDIQLCRSLFGKDIIIQNAYATTETRLIAQQLINIEDSITEPIVPIGKEAIGKKVLLVDSETGDLIARDGIGEIVVESKHISPGYINSTVDNYTSFQKMSGNTIRYHTGDLGRRGKDGTLTFMGRVDQQIIMNGTAINPSIIEGCYINRADIREAAVIHRIRGGITEFCVFLVIKVRNNTKDIIETMESHHRSTLPNTPLPFSYYLLKKLPKNENGKVDKLILSKIIAQ